MRTSPSFIRRSQSSHNNQLACVIHPHSQYHPNTSQQSIIETEVVYLKPWTQIIRQVPQITSSIQPPPQQQPIASTSRPNPLPWPMTTGRWTMIQCFKCNSPNHIKWYCPWYCCPECRQFSPGHAYWFCPDWKSDPSISHYGYYDHEYSIQE